MPSKRNKRGRRQQGQKELEAPTKGSSTTSTPAGKNFDAAELRIVLIGGRRADEPIGKSSVANIIMGRDVFETNRTAKSVMRQREVSGRQVTMVDTPGWRSHYPLALTPKLTRLEIQQSVHLCPPGPNVFLIVIPLDTTLVGTASSVEEHVSSLLSDRVWKHTIVVFTVVDQNKMRTATDLIRTDVHLRQLTKKCENRFHVLNINGRGDQRQVTELLEKMEQMVDRNGCHYETERENHVLDLEEVKEMEAERRKADQQYTTRLPKYTGLTELRILLLGRYWSGKSSAGNTILGRSVFKVGQGRTVHCEVGHGEVAGRHLTVMDSPGWFYNSQLQDTSEMDKLEIQRSVALCPPGPRAVLLMVPVDKAFTNEQKVAVEQHMSLLTPSVWSYTVVLFTWGDWLGDSTIEHHIEAEGEDLRWLIDKCGNRYHVLNNAKEDDGQVTELLEKIEEMVARNGGGHFEDDGGVSKTLSERKRNIEDQVCTFMSRVRRQRTALKVLLEGEHQSLQDVRVMLVGVKQSGRSRAGNYILQETVFKETLWKEFETQTKLTEYVRQQRRVADRNLIVVNSPDWSTTPASQKIKRGLTLCSPGPHAVLLTVSVMSSFSEADRRSVEELMELLGDRVWKHTLLLFTSGFWLGERCVEEYVQTEGEPLRRLLEKCGYRYHVLQFSRYLPSEVTELVMKIEDMVVRNRGHFRGLPDSREDGSIRDRGHFGVGDETRQMAQFEGLAKIQTAVKEEWEKREEECKRREEERLERMLKFVMAEPEEPTQEPEEPTQPAVRRRRSNPWSPPSMSGGPPAEPGSEYVLSAHHKVYDWLKTVPHGPVASSGYDTLGEALCQEDADVMSRVLFGASPPTLTLRSRRNSM